MKPFSDQSETWIGISIPFKDAKSVAYENSTLKYVHVKADQIANFIKLHLFKSRPLFELSLTLRKANTDDRLRRFTDEPGLIASDFGKKFTGLYFQKIKVQMYVIDERKEYIETLRKHFESLVVRYFIDNPSKYSNWEYSLRNPRPIKTYKGIQTAVIVNFPLFEFETF